MKKTANILLIIVFLGLCLVPLAGWIFGYENVNAEKRALAAMPRIADENGLNTAFTTEFDDYYTDTFAFRPDLITAHAAVRGALFGESVSDQVILGKDGWLFFAPTLDDYLKRDTLTDGETDRLARTLELQRDILAQRGVLFVFAVAPNKASLYGEYMPDRFVPMDGLSNSQMLQAALDARGFDYIDLHALLSGSDIELYHQLDTHWNNTGALIAYDAVLSRIAQQTDGFEYPVYAPGDFEAIQNWQGDLSGMLYPSAGMLDTQHVYDIEKLYTSARPIRSMEDMTIETQCETGSLAAVMFRDSFANALIPLFSNAFGQITYSRATPYDYSLVGDGTDVVILQIVERNLPDLLESAPKIAAVPTALQAGPQKTGMEMTSMRVEDEGEMIHIYGAAEPPGWTPDGRYQVFVRLNDGDGTVFAAFPICEAAEFADHANTAFSLRIEKSMLPDGAFTADIMLFDGQTYWVDTLLEVGEIEELTANPR